MGFEFKIKVKLNSSEKEEINALLPSVKRGNVYDDEIIFESDGIYVCKYDKPDLWLRLEELKLYLENRKMKWEAEEL